MIEEEHIISFRAQLVEDASRDQTQYLKYVQDELPTILKMIRILTNLNKEKRELLESKDHDTSILKTRLEESK